MRVDLELASVDTSVRHDVFAVRKHQVDRSGLIVGGFGCAIVGTLGLLHGGYFSTAWGWGALAALWLASLASRQSDRLRLGHLEIAFIGGLAAFLALICGLVLLVCFAAGADSRATAWSLGSGGGARRCPARAASYASGAGRRPRRNHDRLWLWPGDKAVSLASRWSL